MSPFGWNDFEPKRECWGCGSMIPQDAEHCPHCGLYVGGAIEVGAVEDDLLAEEEFGEEPIY